MGLSTLRPDSTTTLTGTVSGAASAHAALSDDTSSYVALDQDEIWVGGYGDFTLPAGAVIKRVVIRATAHATAPGTYGRITADLYGISLPPGTSVAETVLLGPDLATVNIVSAVRPEKTWSEANIDAAGVSLASADVAIEITEAYIDVIYVDQPQVTPTAPTGTVTTTNLPVVTWTRSLDSAGGSQTTWQVRVFTDAVYGAGGFDPATSSAAAESDVTSTAAMTWTVDEPLADDTYRAYVRIAQTVNGYLHWSDWENIEFTVAVDLPGAPTITVTGVDDEAKITVDIDEQTGTATTDRLELQRSLDGGVTWEAARTLEGGGIVGLPYVVAVQGTADTADGTSHSLLLPAPFGGIQENDLLVAFVGMDGNPTLSWPEGWTEIKDEAGNGNAVRAGVAWKRASGGESGSVTLTTSASEGGGARILCIRGAHTESAPQISAGVSGSSTNSNPDSITTSGWGTWTTLFVAATVNDGNVAVTAGPSGYVGFGNTRWANASGAGVATAYRRLLSQIEDPGTFTHSAEDTRAFTVAVRGATQLDVVYDYEAPNGTTVQYRARALHDYNGEWAASDWATDSDSWASSGWWLKHPHQPELNVEVTPRDLPSQQRAGRQGIFQPIGSSSVVVVQDTRAPATGQVILRALTEQAQADLDALLDESATLMLQGPPGEGAPDYIRVLAHDRARIISGLADASRVWETLDYVVVPSPPGAVVNWP